MTVNALKMRFLYESVLTNVPNEGASPFHAAQTPALVERFIDPWQLPRDAVIRDMGSGHGYFLEAMTQRGYTGVRGYTLSRVDHDACKERDLPIWIGDMHWLDDADESVDLIWSRHSLQQSPMPYLALLEYNRVLRPGARMYLEVPRPDAPRQHELSAHNYSIMGRTQWLALLQRTGFDVEWYEFDMPCRWQDQETQEHSYIFLCTRRRPVDIK